MAEVTAKLVKELREMTGAGMMDCKKVLVEADGDIEKAVDLLRERGAALVEKKAGRVAAMGLVKVAFSEDSKKAVAVEINSETDFVSKNEEFKSFVANVADIALNSKVETLEELMAAPYESSTVEDGLRGLIAKIGENMSLRRFVKCEEDGVVYKGYTHGGGTIGVIVGIKTQASSQDCDVVGKDVAMQVASMNPKYLNRDSVDADFLAREKEILTQEVINEGKPAAIADKIVIGKLNKELSNICLVDQKFVKDSDLTVQQYVDQVAKEVGSDMSVVSMARYEVGEGIEKKEENFAEEVAAQMAK